MSSSNPAPPDPHLVASSSTEYHAANDTLPLNDSQSVSVAPPSVQQPSLPERSVPSDEKTDALDSVEAQQQAYGGGYISMGDHGDALHNPQQQRNSGPFSGLQIDRTSEIPSTTSLFGNGLHQLRSFLSQLHTLGTAKQRLLLVQACYLGVAAMLGTLLRLVLAQLFGQACSNPGTIGWIADDAALCVTADGSASQQGGIIFADLPANILGSFVMGLLQDGASLDLAIHTPLAFLGPSNVLQGYDVLHLAAKTGFCGSLTTFSGWNSEMVIMLVGTEATHKPSQVWKALLGYVVGIETALGPKLR